MVRATWKLPYVNYILLKQFLYQDDFLDRVVYLWTVSGRIFFGLIKKKLFISRGNSWIKFTVKPSFFNSNLGEYIISKNMGLSIHERNKKKKKKGSKRRKKGVLANPIGYRLEVLGNWEDVWISFNHLTYAEFLHNCINLKRFSNALFESEAIEKTGLLLSHVKVHKTIKYIRVFLTWYDGRKFGVSRKKKMIDRKEWYFAFLKKYIYFFRIWQIRIFWLRYKFSKMEQKLISLIINVEKSVKLYKLGNKSAKIATIPSLKYKYTFYGNKILSKFLLKGNISSQVKNFLLSREEKDFEILKGSMRRKEKRLLKDLLKQKDPLIMRLYYLRQIFNSFVNLKSRRIGLTNILNNKTFNIWYFLLEMCTDNKFIMNLLWIFKKNKQFRKTILTDLNKLLIFLNFINLKNEKLKNLNLKLLNININKVDFRNLLKEIYKIYKINNLTRSKKEDLLELIITSEDFNFFQLFETFRDTRWLKFFIKFIISKQDRNDIKLTSFIQFFKSYFEFKKSINIKSILFYYISIIEKVLKILKIESERKYKTPRSFFCKDIRENKYFYRRKLGFFQRRLKNKNLSLNFFSYLFWIPRFFKKNLSWKNVGQHDFRILNRNLRKYKLATKREYKKRRVNTKWYVFDNLFSSWYSIMGDFNRDFYAFKNWYGWNLYRFYRFFINSRSYFKFLQNTSLKAFYTFYKERLGPSFFTNLVINKHRKMQVTEWWRYWLVCNEGLLKNAVKFLERGDGKKLNKRFFNEFERKEIEDLQTEKAGSLWKLKFSTRISEILNIKQFKKRFLAEKKISLPFLLQNQRFIRYYRGDLVKYIDWLNYLKLPKRMKSISGRAFYFARNWEKQADKLLHLRIYVDWVRLLWVYMLRHKQSKLKDRFFKKGRRNYIFSNYIYFFSIKRALFPLSFEKQSRIRYDWIRKSKLKWIKWMRKYRPLQFLAYIRRRRRRKRFLKYKKRFLMTMGIYYRDPKKDKNLRLSNYRNKINYFKLKYIWLPKIRRAWWLKKKKIKKTKIKKRYRTKRFTFLSKSKYLWNSNFLYLLIYLRVWLATILRRRKNIFLINKKYNYLRRKILLFYNFYIGSKQFKKFKKFTYPGFLYHFIFLVMKYIKILCRFEIKSKRNSAFINKKRRRAKRKGKFLIYKNLYFKEKLNYSKMKFIQLSIDSVFNNLVSKNNYYSFLYQINFGGDFKNWLTRLLSARLLIRTRKSFKDFFLIASNNVAIRTKYMFELKHYLFKTIRKKIRRKNIYILNYYYDLDKSFVFDKNFNYYFLNKSVKKQYFENIKKIKNIFKYDSFKKLVLNDSKEIVNKRQKKVFFKKLNKFLEPIQRGIVKKRVLLWRMRQKFSARLLYKIKDFKKWYMYFYFKKYQNPWKGYAGKKYFHKDYGKYIDYQGKGKVGNFIFFYKKTKQFRPFFVRIMKGLNLFKVTNRKRSLKKNKLFLFYFNNNIRRYSYIVNSTRGLFSKRIKLEGLGLVYSKGRKTKRGIKYKKFVNLRKIHKKGMWSRLTRFRKFGIRHQRNAYYKFLDLKGQALYKKIFFYDKSIRQKWWTLKKIKYKLNKLINLNSIIGNKAIALKIPRKSLLKLSRKDLKNFENVKDKLTKMYLNKRNKIKKVFFYFLRLKQILLNPVVYKRIWNRIDLFFSTVNKNKKNMWFFIRKNINRLEKARKRGIKQNFVEKFRMIFESLIRSKIHLYIISIDNEEVSAELLVRYFLIRLRQSYTIRFMLNPVERELKKLVKLRFLQGFRIRLSGRFTRRQRSKVIKTKFGIMPLTQKRKKIDFNERTTVLKFSILSIRVWLCRAEVEKLNNLTKTVFKSLPIEDIMKDNKLKRYSRYSNNFTNYGFYSEINQTLGSFKNFTLNLIKKKLKNNKKDMRELKRAKPVLYNRLFRDQFRVYEEGKNAKYHQNGFFIDSSVRAFLIYKQFKKKKVKDRWEKFRLIYKQQVGFYKNKIMKKQRLKLSI